ncbi:hypothetical protein QYE76_009652 [Lolium multiflorum]|uniref:Aminotransferase-like plant mobile domain-containing protein n=1 Tax=Lolium multiflorum TaxID=4521 RepID=A0AAD8TVR2_LOLMU|nr:hypothetical protein QYE76_009652 [Lolium multiflorum]
MGVDLSEFKYVEMNMTTPRTWTIEQVKDWLTECFGLNPEVHTVGVHALWTKSVSNILWYLRPVDDTSKWVSWFKGSERRGTNPVALVLPAAKEVAPPEGGYSGGGGYESGQSSQAPGGGGGYEPEQSSHAEDVYSGQGDGYTGEDGEVDGDEENGYRQNQMEEEDTEGETDDDDSDESDDGEEVMFTENHQTTISKRYIPIAQEIAEATTADDIIPRSWGSTVLAATYRGLCNACTLVSPKSGLLGCPLLLQLWSWERFPIGRPDIDAERPFEATWFDDADHIDMPTFGIIWTRRERRFARDQVRNCYPAFTEQFDVLDDRAVIWEPYTAAAVHARYPGGISVLCYRDCAYWMTQSKIIFDVSVEVMAQQRIMRQFGSRQMVDPPPPIAPLPAYVHKYNRKGTSHSSTWWLQRVGSYVDEWLTATTHLWRHDEQFSPQEFEAYLQRYTAAARVRLIPPIDPAEAPPASMYDMYPTQSTAGSRQHAGQMTSDLQDEVAQYTRQVSSGPLLQPRDQQVSWLRRLEEKLRGIYSAITCSRSSDVVQRHLLPPRPSTRHDPRPRVTPTATPRPPPPDRAGGSSWQQQHTPSFDDFHGQHHGSRPRLTSTATPRPPPPDQAGGSSWQQQQHTPSFDDFQYYQQQAAFDEWQQQQAPFMGGAGYSQGYTQHTASNPSWGASDQDAEHMEYYSTQQNYVSMQTPPPEPTQETQYDPESGSWIPARNVRAPDRFGWTPRVTPPPRQPRLRRPPG